ncbi:DNA methyltransferase [Clostridium tepidum]|jgi:DNA modification methylase|uniref:DNA methyltransferase n=1 Tax=Clostridium tepidum TaxID=1962263 RepID=UPI0018ABA5E2|nr:DNA methyltransferase [Clostridium tepidum]
MANKFEEGKVLNKEILDNLRDIEGFPLGEDEDIIKLSAPPYYTACPNPFINDFIEEYGKPYDEETDDYHREPFAADVSEGKNHPIYNAHSYHTKVPHKAIMRYILHYTEPGDIVFDGFCGTGMTGVAAQMCGNPEADLEFKFQIEKEMQDIKWGTRKAILNDLSPIATFIAYNYNNKFDIDNYISEIKRINIELEKKCKWVYLTDHKDGENNFLDDNDDNKGILDYIVWSDVLICSNCNNELVFYDVAVDDNGKVLDEIVCPSCNAIHKKNKLEKKMGLFFDSKTNEAVERAVQEPVLKVYRHGNKKYELYTSDYDREVLKKVYNLNLSGLFYPNELMLFRKGKWGDIWRAGYHKGYFRVHHFYSPRNLFVLSVLWDEILKCKDKRTREVLMFTFTGSLVRLNKTNKYLPSLKMAPGPIMGMLYIPSLYPELNVINGFNNKVKNIERYSQYMSDDFKNSIITNQSSTDLRNIKDNAVDYIFIDPPFGSNIMYSESNFLWEAWLRVFTNMENEAIINQVQKKGLDDYQDLITNSLKEFYRILKPNRWLTLEFNNSKNSVWNTIQEALLRAGFVIADVRILDKKQGTFKQITTNSTVKKDLIISAYKPREGFVENFIKKAGTEDSVWDFVREHLEKLPVVIERGSYLERVAERDAHSLFDRMIAYHVVNGVSIPLDIQEFFKGLDERFIKRDNMYFLSDQVNEYDNARIKFDLPEVQFSLFVEDEKSALAWLYYQLDTPQTYSELQPKFMKEAKPARHEKMPELIDLLQENFIQNEEEKWYIPDITKSGDIQKLREKRLLKEFEEYLNSKSKLKSFRTEAIRVGFAKLWKEKNYKLIVKMGDRIPENVLQEDDKLLMYYDISSSRID